MFIIYLWIFGLNSSFLNRELDLSRWFNTLKNSLLCAMAALNTQIIYIYIYIIYSNFSYPFGCVLVWNSMALLILPFLSLMWPKHPAQVKDMQSSNVLIKLTKLHMVHLWYLHLLVSSIVFVWTWHDMSVGMRSLYDTPILL